MCERQNVYSKCAHKQMTRLWLTKDRPGLSSERATHRDRTTNSSKGSNIWSASTKWARYQDVLTDWLLAVKWLWLWYSNETEEEEEEEVKNRMQRVTLERLRKKWRGRSLCKTRWLHQLPRNSLLAAHCVSPSCTPFPLSISSSCRCHRLCITVMFASFVWRKCWLRWVFVAWHRFETR
jgi:hypothetical protein